MSLSCHSPPKRERGCGTKKRTGSALPRGTWRAPAASLRGVADVRVLGSIGVVETEKPVDVGRFQRKCVDKGVWIRPFGRNVYIMPPYIIDDARLKRLCEALIELVKEEAS